MYRYAVVWFDKDDEEYSFNLIHTQLCESREEAENVKFNLDSIGYDSESIKVYSLTEVTDL